MKNILLRMGMALSLALVLWACSANEETVTVYETDYTISLASLPDGLVLDSARIYVYADSILILDTLLNANDLLTNRITFVVRSDPGAKLKVDYKVYSHGKAIVSGVDLYDPQNPSAAGTSGVLTRDTKLIEELLSEFSSSSLVESSSSFSPTSPAESSSSQANLSSSMESSSSQANVESSSSASELISSSSLGMDKFQVAFVDAVSSITEGNSVTIALKLEGPVGAVLPSSQKVEFLVTGASAADYAVASSMTLPAGMAVGQTRNLTLSATGNDNLVEGNEVVDIQISDAGLVGIGSAADHKVTIMDADKATVEFTTATSTVKENDGSVSVPVRLVITPATASLALPVTVSSYVDETIGDVTYNSGTTSATFAAGKGNGELASVSYSIGKNNVYNEEDERYLSLGLDVASGPALIGTTSMHSLNIDEYDYEYYVATELPSGTGPTTFHVLKPVTTAGVVTLQYKKSLNSTNGLRYTKQTALPDGSVLALDKTSGSIYKLDLMGSTLSSAEWAKAANFSSIVDLDYNATEDVVYISRDVSTTGQQLQQLSATGALVGSYPYSLYSAYPRSITTAGGSGVVSVWPIGDCDMDCSAAEAYAIMVNTASSAFNSGGSGSTLATATGPIHYLDYVVALAYGGDGYYYALEDGGCDANYTGLKRLAPSSAVKVGTSLNIKYAVDMATTPAGNLVILSGGNHCSTLGEYARIILYNPSGSGAMLNEFYIDNEVGTQVDSWGGVTVIRNHTKL